MKIEVSKEQRFHLSSGDRVAVVIVTNNEFASCSYNLPNAVYNIIDWQFLKGVADFIVYAEWLKSQGGDGS